MSLIDSALEDHRPLKMPVGRDDSHTGLHVCEILVAENLGYEFVQSLRPAGGSAVFHYRRDMLRVQGVDVSNFVSKR